MTSPGQNTGDSLGGDPVEERLGELINEFFDRRERGEGLSEEDFLAKYPEQAGELRQHLRGLDLLGKLGSSARQSTLPGGPAPGPAGSSAADPFLGPDKPLPELAGYEILKQIGRGGMGVVFKAVQRSTKRVVALKLLLEGSLASDTSRRRFEREIALAAQLRHPNIIPIYDSGVAEGRMYYAMEHVYGLPLTDYLKVHDSDIPARLRLFVKVGHALGHAHQRGVIHRDLKPSNILVDAEGEPHLLDFGLAKAGALGDMTTSVTAQIIGTPAYMSPEQAAGDPGGIDVRTDIYSLAIILYEMLTEQMPYETSGAMGKILSNIANAEPLPPGKHHAGIDGEISAIVLKGLEKRKEDRYQSVDSFCGDVERYLAGEPITAKPASALYLFRKAIRKHSLAVGVAACLVICVASSFLIGRHVARIERPQNISTGGGNLARTPAGGETPGQESAGLASNRDGAEASRRLEEWLRANFGPEVAKSFALLAGGTVGESISRREDGGMAVVNLLATLMEMAKSDTADESFLMSKDVDLDLSDPQFIPDFNVALDQPEPEPQARPTKAQLAQALETIVWAFRAGGTAVPATEPVPSQSPAAGSPTSKPASTQAAPSPAGESSPAAGPLPAPASPTTTAPTTQPDSYSVSRLPAPTR